MRANFVFFVAKGLNNRTAEQLFIIYYFIFFQNGNEKQVHIYAYVYRTRVQLYRLFTVNDMRTGRKSFVDAKEFLSRAYLLELQIQTMMQQIEKLRALASRVSGGIRKDVVKHDRKTTGMEDTVLKIVEEEEKLTRKIDELVDVKREIREVIDRVEDMTLRMILEKRYLLFQDWETIRIDFGYSCVWAYKWHRRALEVVQQILDERKKGECVI